MSWTKSGFPPFNVLFAYNTHMNNDVVMHYRLQNVLHTFFLLAGMLSLLAVIGWLLFGLVGIIWAIGTGLILLITVSRLSPRLVLYLYGAQRITSEQLKPLSDIVEWLADRSGLAKTPQLYYIPSRTMLAFSVGMHNDTAVGVSHGLIQQLNSREMAGVLAHEISHIQSRDLWVMAMADVISRITSLMALSAYLTVFLYLPLILFEDIPVPWLLLIVLMFAPNLSALMQLALSRTREFHADMQAVNLTGDPQGLISALNKIEHYQKNWIEQLLLPNMRVPYPSLLRTHPITEERIKRLQNMAQQQYSPFLREHVIEYTHPKASRRGPRQHISGLWH